MEIILGILAFMVAVLAVLQGYQMVNVKKKHSWLLNNNPGIEGKLDDIINKLNLMNQRISDIWEKIKD